MIPTRRRDPWGRDLAGRLHELRIASRRLEGNPLGDPADRPLWVYTPPGYPEQGRYRSLYLLQGYTGQVDMWRNRNPFQPTVIERLDEAMQEGRCPLAVVVLPDCWTRYGGSQFIDSAGTGDYQSYLCEEVVDSVDARFATRAVAASRGVMGKSSGAYGAVMANLQRPDRWGGFAALAPDACFEYAYLPDFPAAWSALRQRGGSVEQFWGEVLEKEKLSGSDHALMNAVAMAACYSPGPDGAPRLPWRAETGAIDEEVWNRWLEWDPVRLVPRKLGALAGKALSLECGVRDEFRLYVGASMIHQSLEAAQVKHRFELFEGGHMSIQGRYPAAAAWLLNGLAS